MALIPYDAVNNLSSIQLQKTENKDPNLWAMSRLEREMTEILNNTTLPAETKLALYQQLFHRYGNIERQSEITQQPTNSAKVEQEPAQPQEKFMQNVLKYVPKAKKNKAQILLDHIQNTASINWNDRNELMVDGNTIPNTNIVDLITDLTKDKTASDPPGMKEFIGALGKTNVPRAAIQNKIRTAAIYPTPKRHQLRPNLEESDNEDDMDFSTPLNQRHGTDLTPIRNRFTPLAPSKQKRGRRSVRTQNQTGTGKWVSYYK